MKKQVGFLDRARKRVLSVLWVVVGLVGLWEEEKVNAVSSKLDGRYRGFDVLVLRIWFLEKKDFIGVLCWEAGDCFACKSQPAHCMKD